MKVTSFTNAVIASAAKQSRDAAARSVPQLWIATPQGRLATTGLGVAGLG
jgi:hypothetical protein